MSLKNWKYFPLLKPQLVEPLQNALSVDWPVAALLVQRGIESFDQAQDYFCPSLDQLHNPFLMKDMDRAVERLQKAIDNNQKILIYGDYDVDGTTAVSLVFGFIKKYYSNLEYYIPDRYKEGYGVSTAGIEYARSNNFQLIISLDCGIKSIDKVALASSYGIDFIICDHHEPGAEIPQAAAVLDPKQKDCAYPYKELSGCGVGFKLLQAWCIQQEASLDALYEQLDLVAISTCADIVAMTGENRVLTHFGIQQINKAPRPGVQALIDASGLKKKITVSNVVFGFAPRINAAGRIDHAHGAVQLLLASTLEEAQLFASAVNKHNTDRKDFDKSITEQALELIESNDSWKQAKSTVLYKEDWHKGVVGIVASRCIETYFRPTIILTHSHGHAAGSARSVPGFDLLSAIDECSDLLIQYGGHKYAAGLTMDIDKIDLFRKKFDQVVTSRITDEQLIPSIEIDLEIPLAEVSHKLYRIVQRMQPFGPQNLEPIFACKNVVVKNPPKLLKDAHLKMEVTQGNGNESFTALAFNKKEWYDQLTQGSLIDICFTLEENEFNGNISLQLMLRDIKFVS
jgi:single-stranded-DNA-specific exonuclease